MAKKEKAPLAKAKKKKWFSILAPKIFNEMHVGQTTAYGASELAGRKVNLNLATITDNPKNQGNEIKLTVDAVDGETAKTKLVEYCITPSAVRRMVRRGKNRVDDSFICYTSEKIRIRIKPFILTSAKTNKSVLTKIRKATRSFVRKYVRTLDYDRFVSELISHKFQMTLKAELKKIFPLRACEIRQMLIENKRVQKEEEALEEESKKQESKKEEEDEDFDDGQEEGAKGKKGAEQNEAQNIESQGQEGAEEEEQEEAQQ